MIDIPDPRMFKEVIDCAGYALMGLVGLFGAWQRRAALDSGRMQSVQDKRGSKEDMSIRRLEKVEQEIATLRLRQTEIHHETNIQQKSILKQQSAMFDLLTQQRGVLDRILAKMGGLT
jgi:hypothetical protein